MSIADSPNSGRALPISSILEDRGTFKCRLRTQDGHEIESVLIPMGGRNNRWRTLCVSSQIGCAWGCAFCQTARMGLIRNLEAHEIVGQVRAVRSTFSATVRNVVFMGMGEPLDNLDNVIRAIEELHGDRDRPIARRRIAVSTVGRSDGLRRLGRLGWRRLGVAVSLNAPNDRIRSQIMPINRLEPMAELRKAIAAYPVRAGGHVLIGYVLLAGINDQPEHAEELAEYLDGLPTCLNLIPWNPCDDMPFETPAPEVVERFKRILIEAGQLTFRRHTKGLNAVAACGQLGKRKISTGNLGRIDRNRFGSATMTIGRT